MSMKCNEDRSIGCQNKRYTERKEKVIEGREKILIIIESKYHLIKTELL